MSEVTGRVCSRCGQPVKTIMVDGQARDWHDQSGRSRSLRLRPHRVGHWWLCLRCWLNKDERREARRVNAPARGLS
jgi:hypothetical protein